MALLKELHVQWLGGTGLHHGPIVIGPQPKTLSIKKPVIKTLVKLDWPVVRMSEVLSVEQGSATFS